MNEASKTNAIRSDEFKRRFFAGRVLDIGCGQDPVTPDAVRFDRADGDAQRILDYLAAESFDCVHSSHCLEHMADVPGALNQWWALVKPGGYLVIVVPDEDLYEQRHWPSLFNADHKATFRIFRDASWSPVSYDIVDLVRRLPDAVLIEVEIHDHGFDGALWMRTPPIDQTLGAALAQIQIVAQKKT
jgi:SAM-dependent methyltransferase